MTKTCKVGMPASYSEKCGFDSKALLSAIMTAVCGYSLSVSLSLFQMILLNQPRLPLSHISQIIIFKKVTNQIDAVN